MTGIRPIRVLAVCEARRPNFNVVRPEAAQIAGLHLSGQAEVTVVCNPDAVSIPYFQQHGLRVITDPLARKLSLRSIRTLRTELRRGDYDILHLFTNRAISNGAMAAVGLPVKVVAYRGQTGNTGRWDPGSYLGVLHPRIDMVIGVADAVSEYLRTQQWSRSKVATVYKGHDVAWYNAPSADLTALQLPEDAVVVSLIADLRPRKGLHVLMAATHHFAPNANIHILLVGAEANDPRVQTEIARAAVPGHVHALGYRSDAPQLAAASGIIVLPTTKREGLSRAVIEGMACGRPAVVTDTGGNAELVADGVTGLVVPPEDPVALGEALSRLALNAGLRREMGHAARSRISTTFNVRQGVTGTLVVYRRVLNRPDPGLPRPTGMNELE